MVWMQLLEIEYYNENCGCWIFWIYVIYWLLGKEPEEIQAWLQIHVVNAHYVGGYLQILFLKSVWVKGLDQEELGVLKICCGIPRK